MNLSQGLMAWALGGGGEVKGQPDRVLVFEGFGDPMPDAFRNQERIARGQRHRFPRFKAKLRGSL